MLKKQKIYKIEIFLKTSKISKHYVRNVKTCLNIKSVEKYEGNKLQQKYENLKNMEKVIKNILKKMYKNLHEKR